jgi:hypothetical protein
MGMLPRGRSGAVLTIVAGALAMVLALFVILTSLASYKSVTVERRWADTLGTREEFLARHPPTEANAEALELERLSAALGIDTAPRHQDDRARPEPGAGMSGELKKTAGDWRDAQLGRDHRRIDRPPAGVVAFLAERAETLAALRDHLIDGATPRWEMRMELNEQAPIPNLLGHIDLQKLLVTDALVRVHGGDTAGAQRSLEAGWRLMQALRDSPILISQLIAIADARMLAAALRQLEQPAAAWSRRLAEHDFRASFLEAMRYEGWVWTQYEDGTLAGAGDVGPMTRLFGGVAKPYWSLCVADASDAWRERLDRLAGVRGICDYDLSLYGADLKIDLPRWNQIGKIVVPNLAGAVHPLGRLELELELTARLLELERSASSPGDARSDACPRDRWIYETGEDGSMGLGLDREPDWSGQRGHGPVSRFRLAPAG